MLTLINYGNRFEQTEAVQLPKDVQSVSFSYDGGRVAVSVNGVQVFSSHLGGHDCEIELNSK